MPPEVLEKPETKLADLAREILLCEINGDYQSACEMAISVLADAPDEYPELEEWNQAIARARKDRT